MSSEELNPAPSEVVEPVVDAPVVEGKVEEVQLQELQSQTVVEEKQV